MKQKFNISEYITIGYPVVKTTWNALDEFGLLLSLPRLSGESNKNYKHRLMDVSVHRANSSINGLVYGITRELGYSLFNPIRIDPKMRYGGKFFPRDPMIEFSHSIVRLYSDYSNRVIDTEIDRYEPGGNYEFLGLLVDGINIHSTYFEAELLLEDYRWTRSMTILNQSNRVTVSRTSEGSTRVQLHPFICNGTFYSSDTKTFRQEVIGTPGSLGLYSIDYNRGVLSSYTIPPLDSVIQYQYIKYPWKPVASPVICCSIPHEDFKKKMYEQEGDSYGLPTTLGVDIINELMSVYPQCWGA